MSVGWVSIPCMPQPNPREHRTQLSTEAPSVARIPPPNRLQVLRRRLGSILLWPCAMMETPFVTAARARRLGTPDTTGTSGPTPPTAPRPMGCTPKKNNAKAEHMRTVRLQLLLQHVTTQKAPRLELEVVEVAAARRRGDRSAARSPRTAGSW